MCAPRAYHGPRTLSVHAACTATAPTPSRPSPGVSPSMCLRVTRQDASAFNQPLSLDTSRVTDMFYMFKVRPPRAPYCPSLRSDPPCTLHAPPPPSTPSRLYPRVCRPPRASV